MTDETLYVNADWSAFVPAGSADAAFGVAPADVERLGLRDALERFQGEPEEAPEEKEAPKPADKSLRKPATK